MRIKCVYDHHLSNLIHRCPDDDDILGSFATNATRQLDVLWHDGDALCVDGAQVCVLEQADEIGLACLLKCADSGRLKAEIGLEVLRDFTHETLKRQLADQQLGRLLVATNLTQRDGARSVAMRFLDAARRRCRFACRLRGELFTRCFAAGRLASSLFRASHLLACEIDAS